VGRRGIPRRGALPRSRRTSQHGKRVLVEKGNFLREDMSLGTGEAMARDALHS